MYFPRVKWVKFLVAILLGNGLYFALSPYLPPAARNAAAGFNVGTLLDFWFCVLIYGLLELGASADGNRTRNRDRNG
jgi:hypothetical protein